MHMLIVSIYVKPKIAPTLPLTILCSLIRIIPISKNSYYPAAPQSQESAEILANHIVKSLNSSFKALASGGCPPRRQTPAESKMLQSFKI